MPPESDRDGSSPAPMLSDRAPSERATKMRLLVLVLLILGIAAMLFMRVSPEDRVVEETFKMIEEKQRAAEAKASAMSKGRAFDFATASSPEVFDKRIALVVEARKANEDLLATGNSAGERLASQLRAKKVPEEKIQETLKTFNDRVWSNRRKVFTESGRMYAAGQEFLEYLRQNWGHWRYDAENKSFDPETDEIDKGIAQRQLALQEAIKSQKAAMEW